MRQASAPGLLAILPEAWEMDAPPSWMIYIGTPATVPTPTCPVAVGDFSRHELVTTGLDAAFDFYTRLFGWQKTGDHDMGPRPEGGATKARAQGCEAGVNALQVTRGEPPPSPSSRDGEQPPRAAPARRPGSLRARTRSLRCTRRWLPAAPPPR